MNDFKKTVLKLIPDLKKQEAILEVEKYLTSEQKERLIAILEKLNSQANEKILREIDFILEEAKNQAFEQILAEEREEAEKIEKDYQKKVRQIFKKGREKIKKILESA